MDEALLFHPFLTYGGKEMSKLSEVDVNIKVGTTLNASDIKFYNSLEKPFSVHGVFYADGMFRRLPEDVAKSVSPGVEYVHNLSAGGRIRFATNSPYVAISAKMPEPKVMSRMTATGTAGFDLYADNVCIKTFVPPDGIEKMDGYESLIELPCDGAMREITINMPLYSIVTSLMIGLKDGSFVAQAKPYVNEKPIVYYGSSITQGGCATRPGMTYESIISRKLNCDFISLGFAGNARAEDEIIEYVKELDMSMFVYDYDHNAPNLEHLMATHEKMFKAVREAKGDIPIIIMPRPKHNLDPEEEKRKLVIERTYNNAVASGDKNVYYIDNKALTALCGDDGMVDGCHPTDLGFFSMASAVIDVIEKNNLI